MNKRTEIQIEGEKFLNKVEELLLDILPPHRRKLFNSIQRLNIAKEEGLEGFHLSIYYNSK